MNWLDKLELVQLLRTVMVSVDEKWDIADIQFDAVYFLVLLCGLSIVSYCLDIYHLVKRSTMTETLIGMLLPGMAALSGAVWLTEYGSIPSAQALAELAGRPISLALSVQLAACAVLFGFVFVMTRLYRWKKGGKRTGGQEGKKGQERKEEWRWIATYALDFLTALMAFAAGCYGVFTNVVLHKGRNLFAGCSTLYGIFLYLLPLLLFKMVLLLLLALLRVYGARITVFPYRQGMDAGRYLYRWLFLYHCPLLREVLVFFLVTGFFLIKAAGEVSREDALMAAAVFGILAAGYLWAAARLSAAPLRKFRMWGSSGHPGQHEQSEQFKHCEHLKEQFCREYFCEDPLFRNEEYTLTRNFLVEEKNFSGIFYLGDLRYLPGGWMHDGKKWLHIVTFRDGSRISLEKGKQNSEEIFRGINRYAKSYGIAESSAMAADIATRQKAYTDTIKGQLLAVWTVVMMLILTVVMMDGLGAWG